jgi:hypothetical protein
MACFEVGGLSQRLPLFPFATFVNLHWYFERRKGLSRVKNLPETFGVIDIIDMGDLYNSFAGYWIGIYALRCFASPVNLLDGILQDVAGLQYLVAGVVTGISMCTMRLFLIHWLLHQSHAYEEYMLGIMILLTISLKLEMSYRYVIPFWTLTCK